MKRLIANAVILGLVLFGIGVLGFFGLVQTEGQAASVLFLCFFAMIITTMAIPAMVLFGFLLKEIIKMTWGKKKEEKADLG